MASSVPVSSCTVGFPRMGPQRELKFALEKFWRQKISENELRQVSNAVEAANWKIQLENQMDLIPVGMFSLYDHVLDWTYYLGCAPTRFKNLSTGLEQYFAMARGVDGIPALDMTKWFDTNYHYEVPEFNSETSPSSNFAPYLDHVTRAFEVVGKEKTVPVVIGPLTYLNLGKFDGVDFESMFSMILPLYAELFGKLKDLGVKEVQIHEPSLVTNAAEQLLPYLPKVYGDATQSGIIDQSCIKVNLVTYFEEINVEVYQWFLKSQVAAISLDFTRGDNLAIIKKYGFAANKRLGAGVIDGRAVWKFVPEIALPQLHEIRQVVESANGASLSIQTSCSLQHVPYTTNCEQSFEDGVTKGLLGVLSFAYEKLAELRLLKNIVLNGAGCDSESIKQIEKYWSLYYEQNPRKESVQNRLKSITENDFSRPSPFAERRKEQLKSVPILPTTTIGSFPQTALIRSLRRKLKSGEISLQDYRCRIDEQIAYNIGIQEALGLDILVHGEPERTDMVEYFAEKLDGFAFTQNGWVQSYGSRCVRPPIIYADLIRPSHMTVREYVVAQSFTSKPVKGMLTGPVTILNWSFNRQDISRKDQAFQLALCLRDEVADLEVAKCSVIQVDEPALREGMPLKAAKKDTYLKWAVDAFRLCTAVAKNETSIHTHMCYCEFADCMNAIDALDADVNSIENARSDDETIRSFKSIGYTRLLGPGVYDIHSPVIPPKDAMYDKLQSFLKLLPKEQIVVNPDCGLKTRKWPETIAALRNMVDATLQVRASI